MRLDVEWDAAPGVGDLQLDLAQRPAGGDGDQAARRRLAHGGFGEVVQGLGQAFDVAPDQADVVGPLDLDGHAGRLSVLGPAFGGLATGILGVVALLTVHHGGITGGGYAGLSDALTGDLAVEVMLVLGAAKLVATVMSYASGGAGGIFAPSLFMGAMLGGMGGQMPNMPGGMPDMSALGDMGGAGMPDMSAMFGGGLKGKVGKMAMTAAMKRAQKKMKKGKKKKK